MIFHHMHLLHGLALGYAGLCIFCVLRLWPRR